MIFLIAMAGKMALAGIWLLEKPRSLFTHRSPCDLCFLTIRRLGSEVECPERTTLELFHFLCLRLGGHAVSLPLSFISRSRHGCPFLMGKGEGSGRIPGTGNTAGHFWKVQSSIVAIDMQFNINKSRSLVLFLLFCFLTMEG